MNSHYSLTTKTGLLLVVIERIVTAIDLLNSPSKESSVLPSPLISISRYSNLFQLLLLIVSMSI